jgi:outer membrane murein-binding lipoprotein Lpp
MHWVALLAIVLGLTLLAGCMSTSPTKFQAPRSASHFELSEDAVDSQAKNALGEHLVQTLKAGRYVAAFENEDYVFYECADKCVLWGLHPSADKGGICLPKPGSKATPYLWVYVVRSKQGLGVVGNIADAAEAGNIRVLHYGSAPSAELMQKISVVGGLP